MSPKGVQQVQKMNGWVEREWMNGFWKAGICLFCTTVCLCATFFCVFLTRSSFYKDDSKRRFMLWKNNKRGIIFHSAAYKEIRAPSLPSPAERRSQIKLMRVFNTPSWVHVLIVEAVLALWLLIALGGKANGSSASSKWFIHSRIITAMIDLLPAHLRDWQVAETRRVHNLWRAQLGSWPGASWPLFVSVVIKTLRTGKSDRVLNWGVWRGSWGGAVLFQHSIVKMMQLEIIFWSMNKMFSSNSVWSFTAFMGKK